MNPTTVKLSQLIPDMVINSRLCGYEDEIGPLADNIRAIGLILPLSVRPAGGNLYSIIDGHRRHQALTMLHTEGGDPDVPVLVRETDDTDARVLSLAANIMRLPLHPADQFEAFKAMLDEGLTPENIAARFSLAVKDVNQRLALGGVIKPFLNAYRDGDLKIEAVKLLTPLSSERQLEVLNQLIDGKSERRSWDYQLRQLVNDKAIFSNNTAVKFVGLAAYEAAGGRVERSLFEDNARLVDTDLLFKLAEEKVPSFIEAMRDGGWMFCMREIDMPKNWGKWERHYASPVFSEDQTVRLAVIETRLDELNEVDHDDWTDDLDDEHTELGDERNEIRRSAVMDYTAEEMAESCIVIHDDYRLTRGIIWPRKQEKPEEGADPGKPEVKGWSQVLLDEVDSHGSVAAQLAIMREPGIADAMLLAGMYQDTLNTNNARVMALNSTDRFCDNQINAGLELTKALKGFGLKHGDFWLLVDEIMKWEQPQRDQLRAVLVARAMKKRRGKELEDALFRLDTADVMATWVPEKEFFERLNTAQLNEIWLELTGFNFKEPTTKKSAVEMVAVKAAAANWMPRHLRFGMKQGVHVLAVEPKKAKGRVKGQPILTKVGEDGKTEKKRKAA